MSVTKNGKITIDDKFIKNKIFVSEAFNDEFDNLLHHCSVVYNEVGKNFSVRIRKDVNNELMVCFI